MTSREEELLKPLNEHGIYTMEQFRKAQEEVFIDISIFVRELSPSSKKLLEKILND